MKWLFLLLLAAPSVWSAEGGLVGNGGDVIECRAAVGRPFHGVYALDYVLTYQVSNENADIVPARSLQASVQRIRAILAAKLPELLFGFDSFTAFYRNTKIMNAPRFWEEAPFGLVDIKDEKMFSLVPDNCKKEGALRIQQAIVRQFPSGIPSLHEMVVYKFAPSVLDHVERNVPLQASFLYIHEWLWDFSRDVEKNRRINRLIHSTEFERLSSADLREIFVRMGVTLPKMLSPAFHEEICMPNPPSVRPFLSSKLSGAKEYVLGKIRPYIRKRVCVPGVICEAAWVDHSDPAQGNLNVFTRLDAIVKLVLRGNPEKLFVELWGNPANPSAHFIISRCLVDQDTGRLDCTKLQSANQSDFLLPGQNEYSGNQDMLLRGGMTDRCLRVATMNRNAGQNPPMVTDHDVVFHIAY